MFTASRCERTHLLGKAPVMKTAIQIPTQLKNKRKHATPMVDLIVETHTGCKAGLSPRKPPRPTRALIFKPTRSRQNTTCRSSDTKTTTTVPRVANSTSPTTRYHHALCAVYSPSHSASVVLSSRAFGRPLLAAWGRQLSPFSRSISFKQESFCE